MASSAHPAVASLAEDPWPPRPALPGSMMASFGKQSWHFFALAVALLYLQFGALSLLFVYGPDPEFDQAPPLGLLRADPAPPSPRRPEALSGSTALRLLVELDRATGHQPAGGRKLGGVWEGGEPGEGLPTLVSLEGGGGQLRALARPGSLLGDERDWVARCFSRERPDRSGRFPFVVHAAQGGRVERVTWPEQRELTPAMRCASSVLESLRVADAGARPSVAGVIEISAPAPGSARVLVTIEARLVQP